MTKEEKMKEEITSWFLCVSFIQQGAKERNIKNMIIKQDQFPKVDEVQEELEKEFVTVEEVVLINWKKVNKDYE